VPERKPATGKGRAATLALAAVLFLVNALVAGRLWRIGFLDQMGSSEGPVLAIIRHILKHWGDLLWFPAWLSGMPFVQVYNPGLHATVALVAAVTSLPPERAYHWVAALLYALGPVTLYWLCYRLTLSRVHAFLTGLLYSLFSPSGLLAGVIRADMGGLFHARRYQVLVHYGEGPHLAVLTLIPLIIWALGRAVVGERGRFIPVASLLLAAAVVTNWTGTVGLATAVAAYFLSQLGNLRPSRWLVALGLAMVGYLLICPWVPPSVVALMPGNAQNSVGVRFGNAHLWTLLAFMALMTAAHFLLERGHVARGLRFFIFFFLCSGFIVLPDVWWNIAVIPQPRRLHLEMEMALAGIVMYPVAWVWDRGGHGFRIGFAALLVLLSAAQFRTYRAYARELTRPVRIENTIEYREAQWFDRNLPGTRVFAPGSVAIWMNAFNDEPQMVGCCDQGVPSLEHRIAFYTVYVRDKAGDREAEYSILWLKAYGAAAVGVSGPRSSEYFKPFSTPKKFEGVLPALWRDGDDVIYQVTGGAHSLAHVIRPDQEVRRAPVHGLDVEPLRPFVAALEDPLLPPARFTWLNEHQARIDAQVQAGELVSVQISYAPGWDAEANGVRARVRRDALGLTIVEPPCSGACTILLSYNGGAERQWTRVGQFAGIGLCVFWPLAMWGRRRGYSLSASSRTSRS